MPGTKLSTTPSPPVWLPHMSKRWSAKSKAISNTMHQEPSRRLFSGRRLELSNASSTVPRVWRRQPQESVDFYGVNSYQWCGDQTFYSSGYNILVNDYKHFTKPMFSEYGCNEVLPRNFDEVPVLYTNDMIDVFSGGLVYEFTQEPNNYGLVKVLSNGDVKVLRDFIQLKTNSTPYPS